jgi:uncharacterized membrane protein YraQ (UPF0718 family)
MMNKFQEINNGQKFMITIGLVYLFVYFLNKDYALKAFNNFGDMIFKVIPAIILVFVVMFLVNLFVTPKVIKKYLGKSSGSKGVLYSLLASSFITAPPYILFPLLRDLKRSGMKDSLIATFLYNRNVQISFIPIMIFYFGFKYTLVISFYIIIFAVLNGLIIGKIMKQK